MPCTARAWKNLLPRQFRQNTDGTWGLTDPSLTYSKFLDLWLENYAKPAIEFYAAQGCYFIDFGLESWPTHYWHPNEDYCKENQGDAWYPVDKLTVAPEIPVVTGERVLNSLLTDQYAQVTSSDKAVLLDALNQTICGARDADPPTIAGADPAALAHIFDIAGQLRVKGDYIAQKVRDTYRRLYEWKSRHHPKMVIVFSTHGNYLETLKLHAEEVVYVDWFGPDFTPTRGTTGFRDFIYQPLASVIQDNSNKIWGMGSFETAIRISANHMGLAGTPYASHSLCEWGTMHKNPYRSIGATFQELCDCFYDLDRLNNYIKCFIVNREFQARKYGDVYAAAPPGKIAGSFGVGSYWAPWTFVDSDEPLGATINPRPGITDPNLALWDGDGDGDIWDSDDPLFEARGFGNRWGRSCPALDKLGNPISDVYASKYSYMVYRMYDPASPAYSYWRVPYPMIVNWTASHYDYNSQQLTISLQNTVASAPMFTDCLIFQRSNFDPPWGSVVKARPENLDATLPVPEYFVSADSYSIPGKIFNSMEQPTREFSFNYPLDNGRYCFVYLKDKPGVKGLASVNEITKFSALELKENEHFKGYLDVRDIIPENTEDTISVRVVVKDGKGFETVSPIMQKHVSLIYSGLDFIPVSYALKDSDGGIIEERIEFKRSDDGDWTSLDRRALLAPIYFPKVAESKIVVDANHPFTASSGYYYGYREYDPKKDLAANMLVPNTIYRLHIVARSPNGAKLGAIAYGFDYEPNTPYRVVETQVMGYSLWDIPLGPVSQEYIGDEFMISSPLSEISLLKLFRTNQAGTLVVDKAWLEIVGEYENKVVVDASQPFVTSSGYYYNYQEFNPNSTIEQNALALNAQYCLHVIAHSPDGATLGAAAYGFTYDDAHPAYQLVESQDMGFWNIPLSSEPQEFVGNAFMMSSMLSKVSLLYLYRANSQGTLIIDKAWLERSNYFVNDSDFYLQLTGHLDPMFAYRVHVIARSPDSAAKLGAIAIGYDGSGYNWPDNVTEYCYMRYPGHWAFWELELERASQEYISDVFHMRDIGVKDALACLYRSNNVGTMIIEKAWIAPEGSRPELIELISPDAGVVSDNGYALASYEIDPSQVYQLSVVAQSPNGAQLGVIVSGCDKPNLSLSLSASVPQWDTDRDGMPDYWEIQYGLNPDNYLDAYWDLDNDGITNAEEYQNESDPTSATAQFAPPADTDGDGLPDCWETYYGLNPNNPADVNGDLDYDGYTNLEEYKHGWKPGDPLSPSLLEPLDTDTDGMPDYWEIQYGLNPGNASDAGGDLDGDEHANLEEYRKGTDPTNPNSPGKIVDTDGDGMPDAWETKYGLNPNSAVDASGDLDGDGHANLEECRKGTDPTNPNSPGKIVDTDGDGMPDAWETKYGLKPK